ncbi:hypothetical protein TWF718_011179 [Orbilia javanica]|uniref:Uncharacterized protein n=1 Tax=Orbilia javanica TaxID=47235 RepID=A0AAN8MVW5_9PEZI
MPSTTSTTPTFGYSSLGSKSAPVYKPVYKLVTFEDLTEFPTLAQRRKSAGNQPITFSSWQDHHTTEQWVDKARVDREMEEWPVASGAGYIKTFMGMGKTRREILDKYLKKLNEEDTSTDMIGAWESEYLYPGEPVLNKKTGEKVRSATTFWVIVKREKRVPEPLNIKIQGGSSSEKGSEKLKGSSGTPKGVLKDDKKSSHSSKDSDSNVLIQELLDAVTRLNTKDNHPDMQAQLQQAMFMMTRLAQKLEYQAPVSITMPAQIPAQYQPVPVFQIQDQKLPTYTRSALPPPPYNQFLPEDPQLQRMNPNIQPNMQPNIQPNMQPGMQPGMQPNMQPTLTTNIQQGMFPLKLHYDNSNRARQNFDGNGGYPFNPHLNSVEPQNYPQRGTLSRRTSSSSLNSHFMGSQSEMMPTRQYEGGRGGNMADQDMQPHSLQMIPSHQNNQRLRNRSRPPQQRPMEPSWQHDSSSSSGGSDEEYRVSRSDGREDSVYNLGHLRNRSRSSTRGGEVDLSPGNRGRRNSVSFSERNGMMSNHGRMMGLNNGYEDDDSGSDDDMHGRRMMMHGMSINRREAKTPGPNYCR